MSEPISFRGEKTFRLSGIQLPDLGILLCVVLPAVTYFGPSFDHEYVAMDRMFSAIFGAMITGFIAAWLSFIPRTITLIDGAVTCRGRLCTTTFSLADVQSVDRVQGQQFWKWNSGWWLRYRGGTLWIVDVGDFQSFIEMILALRPELRDPQVRTPVFLGAARPIAAIAIGAILLSWATYRYPIVNWYHPQAPIMPAFFGAVAVFWMLGASTAERRKPWKMTPKLALRAGVVAGAACAALGGILIANGGLDRSPAVERAMKIIRHEQTAWRGERLVIIAQDSLDPHRSVRCHVRFDAEDRYAVGAVLRLVIHEGALGIEWMDRPGDSGITDLVETTLPKWIKLDQ